LTGRSVSIHPAALEEAVAATEWYAKRSPRAAGLFLDEIDDAIGRISGHPEQFPSFDSGTRRAVLRRFPFLIVFREATGSVEIIAVAHGRRKPGYWRDRI
jgi:plasmid stabilization system protein ParE